MDCPEALDKAARIFSRIDTGDVIAQAYKGGDGCQINRAKATTDLETYERFIYEPTKLLSQESTNATESDTPFSQFIKVILLLIFLGGLFMIKTWPSLHKLYEQIQKHAQINR